MLAFISIEDSIQINKWSLVGLNYEPFISLAFWHFLLKTAKCSRGRKSVQSYFGLKKYKFDNKSRLLLNKDVA